MSTVLATTRLLKTVAQVQALMADGDLEYAFRYIITNGNGGSDYILVTPDSVSTLSEAAVNLTTAEFGTYDIDTDEFISMKTALIDAGELSIPFFITLTQSDIENNTVVYATDYEGNLIGSPGAGYYWNIDHADIDLQDTTGDAYDDFYVALGTETATTAGYGQLYRDAPSQAGFESMITRTPNGTVIHNEDESICAKQLQTPLSGSGAAFIYGRAVKVRLLPTT